jgi:hypothetical protein
MYLPKRTREKLGGLNVYLKALIGAISIADSGFKCTDLERSEQLSKDLDWFILLTTSNNLPRKMLLLSYATSTTSISLILPVIVSSAERYYSHLFLITLYHVNSMLLFILNMLICINRG